MDHRPHADVPRLAKGAQEVTLTPEALDGIKQVAIGVYAKYAEYQDIIDAIQAMAK